jgi:uncharacterized protein
MNHVEIQRQEKDRFFKYHPQSPIAVDRRADFNGLRYYDYDPSLSLELTPEIFETKVDVKMQTSTGDTRWYQRWGKVKFRVEDQDAELTLFLSPGDDRFFVPFMDTTSGTETYSAGRYIESEQLADGSIKIDFNEAYSPYCAYSPRWSCPIPPAENRLKVAVRAGEKSPEGSWIETDY